MLRSASSFHFVFLSFLPQNRSCPLVGTNRLKARVNEWDGVNWVSMNVFNVRCQRNKCNFIVCLLSFASALNAFTHCLILFASIPTINYDFVEFIMFSGYLRCCYFSIYSIRRTSCFAWWRCVTIELRSNNTDVDYSCGNRLIARNRDEKVKTLLDDHRCHQMCITHISIF